LLRITIKINNIIKTTGRVVMVEYAGRYSADSTGLVGDPVKHVENGRRTDRHGPVSLPVVAGLMRGIDAFVMLVTGAISYQALFFWI